MVIFTLVFGKLAKLPAGDIPYPILVFSALLPWQLFATGFSESGNSLVGNAGLISKVYFPRLVIPTSAVLVSLVDFMISLAILVALMTWYGYAPGWQILTLPLFTLLAVAAALSAGIWTAALTVKYRDVRIIVPFVVQMGLYVSPVGFSSSIVPDNWRLAYSLNPMVGVIDGFRWAITDGTSPIYLPGLGLSIGIIALLSISGVHHFRRTERSFADTI
jgi:lipopolysaccharide transport system permease protein